MNVTHGVNDGVGVQPTSLPAQVEGMGGVRTPGPHDSSRRRVGVQAHATRAIQFDCLDGAFTV